MTLLKRQASATLDYMARQVREMVAAGTLTPEQARKLFPGYEARMDVRCSQCGERFAVAPSCCDAQCPRCNSVDIEVL